MHVSYFKYIWPYHCFILFEKVSNDEDQKSMEICIKNQDCQLKMMKC